MPRARNKDDLQKFAAENYSKLTGLISDGKTAIPFLPSEYHGKPTVR